MLTQNVAFLDQLKTQVRLSDDVSKYGQAMQKNFTVLI